MKTGSLNYIDLYFSGSGDGDGVSFVCNVRVFNGISPEQIHIDIPRTNPLIPLFQQPIVQEVSLGATARVLQ